jgi:hypothetical protein
MYFYTLLFFLFIPGHLVSGTDLYYTKNGTISFSSVAQQEIINATSDNLIGVLNSSNRTFLFKVLIRSFEGFNNTLQQEHFNEKYMESEKYPEATFSGKIIEDLDLSIDGVYDVRAKGKLKIHGKEVERIIRSKVSVKNGSIKIESEFRILLSDYNIKIPKVVHEKVASEIMIDLKIELNRNNN